jgi:hypothetical protein
LQRSLEASAEESGELARAAQGGLEFSTQRFRTDAHDQHGDRRF